MDYGISIFLKILIIRETKAIKALYFKIKILFKSRKTPTKKQIKSRNKKIKAKLIKKFNNRKSQSFKISINKTKVICYKKIRKSQIKKVKKIKTKTFYFNVSAK